MKSQERLNCEKFNRCPNIIVRDIVNRFTVERVTVKKKQQMNNKQEKNGHSNPIRNTFV